MSLSTVTDRLRRPEYTGENRCVPCTVVNLLIAAAGSAVLVLLWWPLAPVAFALSAVAIYLRGYLVPGTPTLTKRYLPDRVLDLFGKASGRSEAPADADVDVESELDRMSVLVPTEDGEDYRLDPAFRESWRDRMREVDLESVDTAELASLFGLDESRMEVEEYTQGMGFYLDGARVGFWESDAALRADVAGGRLLADEQPRWADLGPAARSQLLGGLRLFLDRCPDCGGAAEFGRDTVESCCREVEVAAVTCNDCGARLFEVGVEELEI